MAFDLLNMHLAKSTCYLLIRIFNSTDGPDEICEASMTDFSHRQILRVESQCRVCRMVIITLSHMLNQELECLKRIATDLSYSGDDQYYNMRFLHSILLIAEQVKNEFSQFDSSLSSYQILTWWNDFERSEFQGFSEDRRGKYGRDEFLKVFDLEKDLKRYLLEPRQHITVDATKQFLEKLILEKDLVESLSKFGLNTSLSRRTVHMYV